MTDLKKILDNIISWVSKLFEPTRKFPDKPNREYWVSKGYEPYSWSDYDIELAKKEGWTEIKECQEDNYPWLKGTVSGIDPTGFGRFYVPNRRDKSI